MMFKRNPLRPGLLTLAIGATLLLLEHSLYQTLDENGMLQESLFLPLGSVLPASVSDTRRVVR